MKKPEVFNFNRDWACVERHVFDIKVASTLDICMRRLARDEWGSEHRWNARTGPWELSPTDYWHNSIFLRLENLGFQRCETHGEFLNDERCECCTVAENLLSKLVQPRAFTYQWYQCFGMSEYIVDWELALAQAVFPRTKWKIRAGSRHSTVVGSKPRSRGRTDIIFDILLFQSHDAEQILELSS